MKGIWWLVSDIRVSSLCLPCMHILVQFLLPSDSWLWPSVGLELSSVYCVHTVYFTMHLVLNGLNKLLCTVSTSQYAEHVGMAAADSAVVLFELDVQ